MSQKRKFQEIESDSKWDDNAKIEPVFYYSGSCLTCQNKFLSKDEVFDLILPFKRYNYPNDIVLNILKHLIVNQITHFPYCSKACYCKDLYEDGGMVNRCIECFVDMGSTNPRQLCGKHECYYGPPAELPVAKYI